MVCGGSKAQTELPMKVQTWHDEDKVQIVKFGTVEKGVSIGTRRKGTQGGVVATGRIVPSIRRTKMGLLCRVTRCWFSAYCRVLSAAARRSSVQLAMRGGGRSGSGRCQAQNVEEISVMT